MDVLVVDDDSGFTAFVVSLLRDEGYAVGSASDGESAIVAIEESPPSVAVLDVDLPGTSGYEVCRRLRQEFGDDVGVIFVSGRRKEPFDRVGGLLIGADDYLVKPFDPDELLARVRTLLRRMGPAKGDAGDRPNDETSLTPRQREVLRLLAAGLSQRAIAELLVISPKTVATHIQRILGKLGVHSRAEAVAAAHQRQLIGSQAGPHGRDP
jgi:DNA-binding NarL/FixJ family response regulator